jgi:DNA mismatch repair protein MutH
LTWKDTQIGGNHYKKMKIQPAEFIEQNGLSYLQGNAIKYICRFREKNGVEDLRKAKHYIDMLIEFHMQPEAEDKPEKKWLVPRY